MYNIIYLIIDKNGIKKQGIVMEDLNAWVGTVNINGVRHMGT